MWMSFLHQFLFLSTIASYIATVIDGTSSYTIIHIHQSTGTLKSAS